MTIRDLFVPFEDELQLLPSPRVADPPLIEWKAAFGDLFFRVKGMEPEVLWCDPGYTITPRRPLPPNRRATLAKRVSRAFNGRTFFRVVPFEDGEDWALVRPKRLLVKSPVQDFGAIWQWKSDLAGGQKQFAWLSEEPAWFENWLAQEQSDPCEQLRDFARLGSDARLWVPYVAEPGVHEKWATLVPALLRIASNPVEEKPVRAWLCVRGTTITLSPDWPRLNIRSPASTQSLFALLAGAFPLHYDKANWRGVDSPNPPAFLAEPPSQHERLEAALLWRDFAREIGRSDEVEPLLRELLAGSAD